MYYKELKLPTPLTNEGFNFLLNQKISGKNTISPYKFITIFTEFEEYLNPQLKDILKELKIKPNCLKFIGHVDTNINYRKTYVHSDIYYNNDKFVSIPVAINWELFDVCPLLSWWDVGNTKVVYPPDIIDKTNIAYVHDGGIHYGGQNNTNTSEFKLLASYSMKKNQAILFNTGVTHTGEYKVTTPYRATVSIRFPVEEISTWNYAIEVFKNYLD
jgi:hypothetical protein